MGPNADQAHTGQERHAMTARQQLARLLPLALLVVLAIAGLRGALAGPRWNGPLRAEGVAIGVILEVVLGVLLVITIRRDFAAARAAEERASNNADQVAVPDALRFVLRWVLALGMLAIGAVLIASLHLHWFTKPPKPRAQPAGPRPSFSLPPAGGRAAASAFHFPIGPFLFGLLIAALLAAVVVSIWWAARLRRAALPGPVPGYLAEDSAGLREAVESGRAALAAEIDDARAAIIACYLAMEGTLAERGTTRGLADTPDELLARAVKSGIVRGAAARRLTALFYEARFSSHPLGSEQRDAASRALDELAAELRDKAPTADSAASAAGAADLGPSGGASAAGAGGRGPSGGAGGADLGPSGGAGGAAGAP
jgi:hypothetical protein